MPRTLQDDAPTIAKVTELYGSGLSQRMLAKELGVSRDVVRGFMYRNEIERRAPRPVPIQDDPEIVTRVAELCGRGLSLRKVAGEMGSTVAVVQRVMRRNGIERRRGLSQDDPATIAKVAELYESGLSVRLVGQELGFSKASMLDFMRRNGIERRQRVGGIPKILPDTPQTIAKVAELYGSGLTLHEVAAEFGVEWYTIQRFMVRNDIDRRAKKRPVLMGESPEDVERVKTLYESGMNVSEVAEAEGVTWGTVAAFMERHGIEARPTSGPGSDRWIENISYIGVHARVKRVHGQAMTCTKCGTSDGPIEWAQISEDMADVDGYAEMCIPCHRAHDATERKRSGKTRQPRRVFDGPTYQALHIRVRKERGPANDYPCSKCGIDRGQLPHNGHMHWANLTNDYHDVNDFAVMCPACHGVYDAERKRNGSFVPFDHPKELVH